MDCLDLYLSLEECVWSGQLWICLNQHLLTAVIVLITHLNCLPSPELGDNYRIISNLVGTDLWLHLDMLLAAYKVSTWVHSSVLKQQFCSCYRLAVFLPNVVIEILASKELMLGNVAFRRWLGHQRSVIRTVFSALMKGTPRISLTPFLSFESTVKIQQSETQERSAFTRTWPSWHMISDFQLPKIWDANFSYL